MVLGGERPPVSESKERPLSNSVLKYYIAGPVHGNTYLEGSQLGPRSEAGVQPYADLDVVDCMSVSPLECDTRVTYQLEANKGVV